MEKPDDDKLGASVEGYLKRRRSEFRKNASVVDRWLEILPEHLHGSCSLESIAGGVMRVAVEPGPYMHELGVLSNELLHRIQQMSPQSGVRKIKLVPRGVSEAATDDKQ